MPEFSYIVPNQCNDMHSQCGTKDPVRAGDDWLAANVPAMVAAGSTVILTWDESSRAQHIVTVTYGRGTIRGKDAGSYTHFNLLAGLEQHYGLPAINGASGKPPFPIPWGRRIPMGSLGQGAAWTGAAGAGRVPCQLAALLAPSSRAGEMPPGWLRGYGTPHRPD
jgi:hypothetical protein